MQHLEVVSNQERHALAAVDLNVVYLLVGMMIVVSLLGDTGLFEWLAVGTAKKARGNMTLITLGLLMATAVLSSPRPGSWWFQNCPHSCRHRICAPYRPPGSPDPASRYAPGH